MIEFNNVKIHTDNIEPEALEQVHTIESEGAFGSLPIRIMPDVHAGKGICIGFTAPLTDYVNPNHVGVDIGCCIDTWVTNIPTGNLHQKDLKNIERRVRSKVPFGMTVHQKSVVEPREFLKFLNKYVAKCASTWELIDPHTWTESDITKFCARVGQDERLFWKSLGTVGGGNHFVEFGAVAGMLAYTIHCGSRNLGVKIAKYHCGVADKVSSFGSREFKRHLNETIQDIKDNGDVSQIQHAIDTLKESWTKTHLPGYLSGEEMQGYLNDMVVGLAYSLYNHEVISSRILECLKKTQSNVIVTECIRSVHNYIDMSDHMIRKGAVRSYEGEKMVIPFNMRDGLAICTGKSNPDWNCSCSHGAGRKMSRSKAKKTLSVEDFQRQMEGIVSTSVGAGTIDEAPDAYKDTDEIKNLISETCEILYMVKPIINLKDKNTATL